MRDLTIDQSTIYYAMYVGKQEVTDADGYGTGQNAPKYTIPRKVKVCVSTPTGNAESNPFGYFTNYDKIITTANKEFKADEYSVLWIDVVPVINTDGSTNTPFDYVVKRVAKGITDTAYAISKVANTVDDATYLKSLLDNGAITQEEYDKYKS